MLIDVNSYIGHWPFRRLKGNTCKEQLARMDAAGIEQAVLFNLNGVFYKNVQSANDELYEAIQEDPAYRRRFIPFATINPIYSGWKHDFEESVKRQGAKGIRLHPLYHGYELTNPAVVELAQMAKEHNLPIAMSLRIVDNRPSSWLDIMKEWALKDVLPLIKAVPDAKYLILNLANNSNFTAFNREELSLVRQTNMLMDTSGRMVLELADMMKNCGSNKFAFGSHYPILDPVTGLLRIETLRSGEITDQERKMLYSENAKKFLSL
ncbi:MAG: amidohydrolase family protein [Spirosomataceae bacterium]